jgi:single-strand DNA-binding protein
MASYNRVVLVGNLTRDPEFKTLKSGTALADFGLAVNDRVKTGDVWHDEATFVDCTAFGRTAEICQEFLRSGSQILVEGRLKLEQWEKDGQKRSKLKVICEQMKMLGKREGGEEQAPRQNRQTRTATASSVGNFEEEDVPF